MLSKEKKREEKTLGSLQNDATNNTAAVIPSGKGKEVEKIAEKQTGLEDENKDLVPKEEEATQRDVEELTDESAEQQFEGENIPVCLTPDPNNSYSQKLNMLAKKRISSRIPSSYKDDKDEMEELTAKLKESSVKIDQLEADYESALRERDEIHEELELAEHKIAETRALLHQTEDVNIQTEDRVEALTSELRKYKANMKITTQEIEHFKDALEEERLKVVELNKELARAQSRSEEVQRKAELERKESMDKDKTIDELKVSVDEYQMKMQALYGEVSALQVLIEKSEQQKKELKQRAAAAEREARDATADNEQLAEENQKLNLEIESFYRRLSELQTSYNECQNERSDFECLAMTLQQKVTELKADLVEVKSARQRKLTTSAALQNMSVIERIALCLRCKFVAAFHGVFSF